MKKARSFGIAPFFLVKLEGGGQEFSRISRIDARISRIF